MFGKRMYFVYIVTNKNKNVIYTGVTNNLRARVQQHYDGKISGFSRKYNCKYLVFYEIFDDIYQAIAREKTIKNFRREKKNALIEKMNPEWKFLNQMIEMTNNKYL